MARVVKKFQTEEEYQDWVDGPWMRTPYTCLVTSTGNVHYNDGDDNDLSITIVIKKTGWMKLGSAKMMDHIDEIYRNGEIVSWNDNTYLSDGKGSSHFYRHDKGYCYKDDYKDTPSQSDTKERGGYVPDDFFNMSDRRGINLLFMPRRFAQTHHCGPLSKMYGCRYTKRFLYVRKDDVIKIVFNTDRHIISRRNNSYYPIFYGNSKQPNMTEIHKFAREIIIGDGFRGEIGRGLILTHCNKLFIGKNITKINLDNIRWGRYYRFRMYARKKTEIRKFPSHDAKIINIDDYL